MIKLNDIQKNKIQQAVLQVFPNEMCGVLTADDFIQIDNVDRSPEQSFTLDSVQYGKVVQNAVAIVHSHVKAPNTKLDIDARTPSLKDKKFQKLSGLPWLIVATEGLNVTPPLQLPRLPRAEYVGRDFVWHINDCWTLVQDYYRFELDITLPEVREDFDPLIDDISAVMAEHIAEFGFKDVTRIDDIKNGDMVLLDSMGFLTNHLGVYHDGMILHQLQVSRFDPFEHYIGRINRILRYGR